MSDDNGRHRAQVEGLGPATILLILVLGASLSLLSWNNVSRRLDLENERQTQGYASALGNLLEAELSRLDTSMRRRAQIWVTDAFTKDPAAWQDDVDIVLAENPALLAVLRADPSWEIAGSTEGKQLLREIFPEARQVVDADGEFIVGPLLASDGREVFGVQVRASSDGIDKRTVFALFDAQRFVKNLLNERGLGFALVVGADDHEIYHRGLVNGHLRTSLRKTESIVVPNGKPWRIEVTPVSEIPSAAWEHGPAIALAAGLLLSGLMASALHFGTLSWRREAGWMGRGKRVLWLRRYR